MAPVDDQGAGEPIHDKPGASAEGAAPAFEPGPAPIPGRAAHAIADGEFHPLDPRYVRYLEVSWAIGTVVAGLLLLPAVLVLLLLPIHPAIRLPAAGLALALVGALIWAAQRWPARVYRAASYRVHADGIEIRHGVWWRKAIGVPRSRVQHTDVSQGPLERRYGLATLRIYTAGTEFSQVTLPGLDHAVALPLRDHLLADSQGDAV